jgi:fatty acid CoA ligase FadD32
MTLTWAEVDERAQAVAAALRARVLAGDRAAVLAPQGLDYVVAMLGAFYARVVAVPLFTPDLPGHGERLVRILADAGPACVLTTGAAAPPVTALLLEHGHPRGGHLRGPGAPHKLAGGGGRPVAGCAPATPGSFMTANSL